MITFRYHVVSLVAVLLALAVGIALGGGPLQRSARDTVSGDTEDLAATQTRLALLQDSAAFTDAYAGATADRLVRGALTDRAVTLLALPGADDAHVTRLTDMVQRAGGSVTVRAAVEEKLLDVGNRQLVTELAVQMADAAGGAVAGASDVTGYDQMALLIAHALTTGRAAGSEIDSAGESILAGLDTAGLLTVTGEVRDRGSLVLLVAGAPYGDDEQRTGAGTILSTIVPALDERSDGAVLAGPVESSAEDGLVGSVRADPTAANEVSTVDTVERTAGAVVAVLALGAEADGESGHYGTAAAGDGAVPASGG